MICLYFKESTVTYLVFSDLLGVIRKHFLETVIKYDFKLDRKV